MLDDADLDRAAQAAAFVSFLNAGQVCAATGRILVTEKNHDALAARIAGIAEAIRLGDPLLAETTMGPLNNAQVLPKVEQHVAHIASVDYRAANHASSAACAIGRP